MPPELLGKTNAQLADQYGLAIGGIVAPADATTVPRINGRLGNPAAYLPDLQLTSDEYTNQLKGYQLSYQDADGNIIDDPTLVNLREGWNLVSRTIDGNIRTFFVYGDVTPPQFRLDPDIALVINPLDLKSGLTIRGTVVDDSTGEEFFEQKFSDLDQLALLTRPDGSKYIVLEFTIADRAGNTTDVKLEVTVDPNAPRQQDIGFQDNLPERELSETLLALLGFKQDRPGALG